MLFKKKEKNLSTCELYTKEECRVIEDHISQHFGNFDKVLHELVSPDIHVDIVVIEPSEERNYYTLMTMGMGAHRMNPPEELEHAKVDRAEIMVNLPPEWDIDSEDESWYWPIRWLKIIARFPGQTDKWIGWGNTISAEEPIGNTRFTGVMLISPMTTETEGWACAMPDGSDVNFYQMVPIYEEEMYFKRKNDAEALLLRMNDHMLEMLDVDRENVCADIPLTDKRFTLRERSDRFWEWFTANEEWISDVLEDPRSGSSEEIVGAIHEGVSLIVEDQPFNISPAHEFTFLVNEDVSLFYTLPYVLSRMPKHLEGKWKFFPFKQGMSGKPFNMEMSDTTINAADVELTMDEGQAPRTVDLGFHNKQLMNLPEDDMYYFIHSMIKKMIGEGLMHAFVRDLYTNDKGAKSTFPLTELEQRLKTEFQVEELCMTDNYTIYHCDPEDIAVPRMDISCGATVFPELTYEYFSKGAGINYRLKDLGTLPIFIFYLQDPEKDVQEIMDEMYELSNIIQEELGGKEAGKGSAWRSGFAAGNTFSYLDFFVYDTDDFENNIWNILDRIPHVFFISVMTYADFVMHHISKGADVEKEMNRLHDRGFHQLIAQTIESIPEDERGFALTNIYGRALNNLGRGEEAFKVLMSVQEQGTEDGTWNFRVGYSLFLAGHREESHHYFKRAYELGDTHPDTVRLLEMSRKATMTDGERYKERRSQRIPDNEPLVDFGSLAIWGGADEEYHDIPPSDAFIQEFQDRTGYTLPVSYITLMKEHNGGFLAKDQFMSEEDEFMEIPTYIQGLFSLGNRSRYSVCRVSESFEPDESIGIPIGDLLSSDGGLVYLDYRFSGKDGEPEVACVEDGRVKFLADDFESFVKGLYTYGDDECER